MATVEATMILVTGAGFSAAVGIPETKHIAGLATELVERNLALHPLCAEDRPSIYSGKRSAWEDQVRDRYDVNLLVSLNSIDRLVENARVYRDLCEYEGGPGDIEGLASAAYEGGRSTEWLDKFPGVDRSGLPYGGNGTLVFHRVAELECEVIGAYDKAIEIERVLALMKRIERDLGAIDGIITLNYDTIGDRWAAIARPEHHVSYGLYPEPLDVEILQEELWTNRQGFRRVIGRGTKQKGSKRFPLLKLHGAINLAYCPVASCNSSLVTRDGSAFMHAMFKDDRAGHLHLPVALHCPPEVPPVPGDGSEAKLITRLLVPPSSTKHTRPEWLLLERTQRRALDLLSSADCILFAGLGFRREDVILNELVESLDPSKTRLWAACGSQIPKPLQDLGAEQYGDGYLKCV